MKKIFYIIKLIIGLSISIYLALKLDLNNVSNNEEGLMLIFTILVVLIVSIL